MAEYAGKRMVNLKKHSRGLYLSGDYLTKHPSLHREDSEWKFKGMIKLLCRFMPEITDPKINILDIGGGAGQVLDYVSKYVENEHSTKVHKYALDLCPKTLEKQKATNPDLRKAYNEDISNTNIEAKMMDLALVIDVLEHIPEPLKALAEIKRISKFAVFKVPLEDNLYRRMYNFVKKGRPKRWAETNLGHINFYNSRKLINQLEKNAGDILAYRFTNVYAYYLSSYVYRHKLPNIDRFLYSMANKLNRLSPKFVSYLLTDFMVVLVRCH